MNEILITRVWAMPNKETFLVPPIKDFVDDYVIRPFSWLDPFAGNHSPAAHSNDLNPDTKAYTHADFRDFLDAYGDDSIGKYDGMIIDPPYSATQIKRSYNNIGLEPSMVDTQGFYSTTWDHAIRLGVGTVLMFGWHTNGRKEHYDLVRILMVAHGGNHFDTLCSVWERKNMSLMEF